MRRQKVGKEKDLLFERFCKKRFLALTKLKSNHCVIIKVTEAEGEAKSGKIVEKTGASGGSLGKTLQVFWERIISGEKWIKESH